jgi:hypothetical protein
MRHQLSPDSSKLKKWKDTPKKKEDLLMMLRAKEKPCLLNRRSREKHT